MLIEPEADRMHQDVSQEPIAQMPQVTYPDSLESTAIRQLSKDRLNEIADTTQDGTLIRCRLGRVRFAKGSLQHDALLAQVRLHVGHPVVAVSQHNAVRAFQHHRGDFAILLIDRSQEHMGDDSRPAQAQIHAEATEGLSIRMVFAIIGDAAKAATPRSAGKATDGNRHAVNDAQQRVVTHDLIAQVAPQAFFDNLQIGGLPHKGAAVDVSQSWKKVRVVLAEVLKELLVLRQAQGGVNDFSGQHFTVRERGHGASLSKPLLLGDGWHHLVDLAKTSDNKVVQVHECPPQSGFEISLRILHEPFLLARKTCTSC